jgi:putative flavoprotein involved in K+ transport
LRHEGGVVDVPGLYALGLNFMRRRKSSFIHGAEDDVRDIATHLVAHIQQRKTVRVDHPTRWRDRRILWLAHNR